MPARTVKPATDTAFQSCNCLDSITVLHKYSHKSSITPAHLEKGARGKEVQKMSYRSFDFLTPAERTVEHESCPKLDGAFGDNWSMRGSRRLVRRTATCQIELPYVRKATIATVNLMARSNASTSRVTPGGWWEISRCGRTAEP